MVVCDKIHVLAVLEKSAVANLVPILVVNVVAKLGSLPKALAISLSVSNAAGAEATRLFIAVETAVSA